MLSWQVEKSSPQISPDFSHRIFQVSNRTHNQISPILSETHFCRLGSSNVLQHFGHNCPMSLAIRLAKFDQKCCKTRGKTPKGQLYPFFMPDFPQSEIAATNLYDSGGSLGEELRRRIGRNFSAHFRASFAVQNEPQIFSQNSSQFITPCLVAEILKFHLCELLGFWAPRHFHGATWGSKWP